MRIRDYYNSLIINSRRSSSPTIREARLDLRRVRDLRDGAWRI